MTLIYWASTRSLPRYSALFIYDIQSSQQRHTAVSTIPCADEHTEASEAPCPVLSADGWSDCLTRERLMPESARYHHTATLPSGAHNSSIPVSARLTEFSKGIETGYIFGKNSPPGPAPAPQRSSRLHQVTVRDSLALWEELRTADVQVSFPEDGRSGS